MTIHDGFYLQGFKRIDKGDDGAIFVRYADEERGNAAPKIKEAASYSDMAGFMLYLPKSRERVTACAIVTRSSKNCYQATVYDDRRIKHFKENTLEGLRRTVADFFKEVAP